MCVCGSPPLACIMGMSRLYLTCIPLVSHRRILGIPCIPVSILVLCQFCSSSRSAVSRCIPYCIQLYPYASSCIYISLYPVVT